MIHLAPGNVVTAAADVLVCPASADGQPFGDVARFGARYPDDFEFWVFAREARKDIMVGHGPVWSCRNHFDRHIAWLPVRRIWHDVEPVDLLPGLAEMRRDMDRMFLGRRMSVALPDLGVALDAIDIIFRGWRAPVSIHESQSAMIEAAAAA